MGSDRPPNRTLTLVRAICNIVLAVALPNHSGGGEGDSPAATIAAALSASCQPQCPGQAAGLLRGVPLDQLNRELQELLFPSVIQVVISAQ